jgi:hypothetical protein
MIQNTIFEKTRLRYKPIMTINMAWQMSHIAILPPSEKRLFNLPPKFTKNVIHKKCNSPAGRDPQCLNNPTVNTKNQTTATQPTQAIIKP